MSWTKVGNTFRALLALIAAVVAWRAHHQMRALQLQLDALTDIVHDDVDAAMHRLRGRLRR